MHNTMQCLACLATAVSYERKSSIQFLPYGKYKLDQIFLGVGRSGPGTNPTNIFTCVA